MCNAIIADGATLQSSDVHVYISGCEASNGAASLDRCPLQRGTDVSLNVTFSKDWHNIITNMTTQYN